MTHKRLENAFVRKLFPFFSFQVLDFTIFWFLTFGKNCMQESKFFTVQS